MSDRSNRLHADGRDMTDGLFSRPIPPQPIGERGDSELVTEYLRVKRGWHTAESIACGLAWEIGETGRRRVREAASNSDDVISGPGCPGYQHAVYISVAEFDVQVWKPMWSQIRKMTRRLIRMCRRVHGNGKGSI